MSSWSKPVSLTDAVNQLNATTSVRQLYNALVVIRTNYSKDNESVTALRHHGGIERLLNLLAGNIDTRCKNVILSILANCCVDEKSRLRVLQSSGGIGTLCNIICEAEQESVRNRGCRMLGNLCQTAACCDVIHEDHADVLDAIVSSLMKTEDNDSKVTFCRTIRMLSDTAEHREALLNRNTLKAVASVLHTDDSSVLLAAIRTTSDFINNYRTLVSECGQCLLERHYGIPFPALRETLVFFVVCSEDAAWQLVSQGALDAIVALTSRTDSSDLAEAAVSFLLSVTSNAPGLRPYLGGAGAVEYFIKHMAELGTADETSHRQYRMIDALCQCCRDPNNGIKIRDQGGLTALIDVLSNSKFTGIHDRVISSLICFLYDDASFAVLLQCHLVPTLLSHLYRVAAVTNTLGFIGLSNFGDCGAMKSADITDTSSECACSSYDCETEFNNAEVAGDMREELLNCESSADLTAGEIGANYESSSALQSSILNADSSTTALQPTMTDESIASAVNHGLDITDETSIKTSRYSINSPTYKAVSAWRMESVDDDPNCPKNIWEGAQLYGENFSAVSRSRSFSGSVSPTRSLGSCSDGMSSVRSWSSSSLCDISPQKSPAVSPAWSLDSLGSGVYSPFSNTSYVYPDGACSPSSFSDSNETEPALSDHLKATTTGRTSDELHVDVDGDSVIQAERLVESEREVAESHCSSTVNAIDNYVAELPLTSIPASSPKSQTDTMDMTRECVMNAGNERRQEVDSNPLEVQSNAECDGEEELKHQLSDEEFDVELFRRKRQDERKFSRLLDIANSMYASIESDPAVQTPQQRKRRRSSGCVTPVSSRHKIHCLGSPELEATLPIKEPVVIRDFQDEATNDVTARQCLQAVEGIGSSGLNSDAESTALNDIPVLSGRRKRIAMATERNILALLSRISYSPDTVEHLMNVRTICGLLDYSLQVADPLTASNKILLRLSLSRHGFERALLCLFPIHAACRVEPDWHTSAKVFSLVDSDDDGAQPASSCDGASSPTGDGTCTVRNAEPVQQATHVSSENTEKSSSSGHYSSSLNDKLKSIMSAEGDSGSAQKCDGARLCREIIANLAALAVSGYGQGVISHLLLRGSCHQRERCVCSIFILCQSDEMRRKYLVNMHAVDMLMQLIRTPDSPLFQCAVLALRYQANCLSLPVSMRDDRARTDCHVVDETDDDRVVFVLDDGAHMGASRSVMCRSSDVFAAMLRGTFREATERHIQVQATASGAFRTMIAWLHGQISDDLSSAADFGDLCELIRLYHRYQIPDVVRCRHMLSPLVAAVTADDGDGGKFARIFRLLCVYDDAGRLRRDMVVALLTHPMSLQQRCRAVADIVAEDHETAGQFVSVITAVLLDVMD